MIYIKKQMESLSKCFNPYTMDNLVQALNQWCTDNSMNINQYKMKITNFRHPKNSFAISWLNVA